MLHTYYPKRTGGGSQGRLRAAPAGEWVQAGGGCGVRAARRTMKDTGDDDDKLQRDAALTARDKIFPARG